MLPAFSLIPGFGNDFPVCFLAYNCTRNNKLTAYLALQHFNCIHYYSLASKHVHFIIPGTDSVLLFFPDHLELKWETKISLGESCLHAVAAAGWEPHQRGEQFCAQRDPGSDNYVAVVPCSVSVPCCESLWHPEIFP